MMRSPSRASVFSFLAEETIGPSTSAFNADKSYVLLAIRQRVHEIAFYNHLRCIETCPICFDTQHYPHVKVL
jgi:hypothetical protein